MEFNYFLHPLKTSKGLIKKKVNFFTLPFYHFFYFSLPILLPASTPARTGEKMNSLHKTCCSISLAEMKNFLHCSNSSYCASQDFQLISTDFPYCVDVIYPVPWRTKKQRDCVYNFLKKNLLAACLVPSFIIVITNFSSKCVCKLHESEDFTKLGSCCTVNSDSRKAEKI